MRENRTRKTPNTNAFYAVKTPNTNAFYAVKTEKIVEKILLSKLSGFRTDMFESKCVFKVNIKRLPDMSP